MIDSVVCEMVITGSVFDMSEAVESVVVVVDSVDGVAVVMEAVAESVGSLTCS